MKATNKNSKASKAMKLGYVLLKVIPIEQRNEKTWSNCLKQAWNKVKSTPELNINEVYNKYYNQIFYFINGNVRNTDISQELVNDTFIKANANYFFFDADKGKLNTWLHNIAKNIVIDYFRANKKYSTTTNIENFQDDKGNEFFTVSETKQANDMVENKELLNKMTKAINNLSPKYRQIADLHLIQELNYTEISEMLDISMSNTKVLIMRTKDKLQAQLRYEYSQI